MNIPRWVPHPLSRIKTRKIEWLWHPFIPRGTITTIAGDGEVGKSTVIYDLLARVTIGELMPTVDNEPEQIAEQGSVIILTKEDDPSLIKLRLQAAGADLDFVHLIGLQQKKREAGPVEVIDRLDNTINELARIVTELGNVRAIVVDPVTDFAGQLDMYREDQVRRLLGPVTKLAARLNLAWINVLHLTKDTKKPARQRILGSVGLIAISRSALIVGRVADRRFLMMEKANWAPDKKNAAFLVYSHNGQPVVQWETEYADVKIDEVLAGKSAYITKQQIAASIITNLTMEGPVRSSEVREAARNADISWNTFKAAKEELGIRSFKEGDVWYWEQGAKEPSG